MSDTKPQSLYEYIRAAIEPLKETGVLSDFSLPPDERSPVPFADGAYDGIALYHMGTPEITDETRELMAKAVQTAANGDTENAERLFTELGKAQRAIGLIDELQRYIIDNKDSIPAEEMYKFAVYVITKSWDVECVKFGLSILELLNVEAGETLKAVICVLGLCDEFTLFAVFVMSRWSDGNENIAYLARLTHGWGRIHAIERLEADTEEIRKWLLRDGVHNTVMPSYTALTCWNKSGAAELLFGNEPLSDEDFHGLRDIIDALLDEGPCAGISEVENAEEVLAEFLKKASEKELGLDDYEVIRNIAVHNEGENAEIARQCRDLLNSEKCRGIVKAAVQNGEAVELARILRIDYREDVLRILDTDLDKKAHLCGYLMNDSEYRAKTINIFREKLPLEAMKKAPSNELCLGEKFRNERNLVFLIQELKEYPLEGADLVEASLQCAPPQNRNMALRVLKSWVEIEKTPLRELLPETFKLLCGLRENEVNDRARESMEKLLNE